jgi:hypothetical protein
MSSSTAAEMAALLDISPRTVESHKRRIYAKLDATSQARAVARAAALVSTGARRATPSPSTRTPTWRGRPAGGTR